MLKNKKRALLIQLNQFHLEGKERNSNAII